MDLESVRSLHVLLTHLHLDHLQGLGFFRPLYEPGLDVEVWGPASPVHGLAERIATYLSPPLFPVRLADLPAAITFRNAPETPVRIGSATIQASYVTHQGPTLGYGIEENGKVLAYIPDHEPSLGVSLQDQPAAWISGHDVARDADLLLHDAQYGDDEYPEHVGWGHSAMDHVMAFADKANVDTLLLFHHDPYHTDEELDRLLSDALRGRTARAGRTWLASEGMAFELDDAGFRRLG